MAIEISLKQKVALVTGAGAGIGKACALTLARAGAVVGVNDIDAESADQTVGEIRSMGGEAFLAPADVGDPSEIDRMIKQVSSMSGRIDVLVNNAGFDFERHVSDTSLDDWSHVHNVHLRGMFLVAKTSIPLLSAGSSIVNISSVHAACTEPGYAAYASAKAGILGMTRALAIDLGPKTRVNAVSPGYIQTRLLDMWLESKPDPGKALADAQKLHPMSRLGTPGDVANMVTFLASDLATFITGQNFTVDGGLTAVLPRVNEE